MPFTADPPVLERLALRTAAIDLGRARLGLAISDPGTGMALPHSVLERRGTRHDIARLLGLFAGLRIQAVVVGLPPCGDAEPGSPASASAALCRRFAEALVATSDLPVWLVDEADTTAIAHAELRQLGLRAARRRREVDRVAAARILDRFLAGAPVERVGARPDGG